MFQLISCPWQTISVGFKQPDEGHTTGPPQGREDTAGTTPLCPQEATALVKGPSWGQELVTKLANPFISCKGCQVLI